MKFFLGLMLSTFLFTNAFAADELTPEQKTALAKQVEEFKKLGTDPKVVEAVKAVNTTPLVDYKDMSQDKWDGLTVTDPKVRYFSKTGLAEYLKTKKNDAVAEIFVNAANGTKVAFFSKTSSWSHDTKPKHDVPAKEGKEWEGKVETDKSTGVQSIQHSFPIMDGGKSIGSIVIGFGVKNLK